jgi:hypothetical protein
MEPKELGQIDAEGIVEAMKERLAGAGMVRQFPFFVPAPGLDNR